MRSRLSIASACSVVMLLLGTSLASASGGSSPLTMIRALGVEGNALPNGALMLYVEPGPIATKGIRIYSEPSHTLLALLIDSKFCSTAAGQAWLTSSTSSTPAAAVIKSDLPDARPTVQIPGRPPSDEAIVVWVNGSWPDTGTESDRLIAEGHVGPGSFHFNVSVDATGDPHYCCSSVYCSEMCIDCDGHIFYCCVTPCDCEISCTFIKCLYPC